MALTVEEFDAKYPDDKQDPLRPMTLEEMATVETQVAKRVRVFVDAYLQYPTAKNFDLLIGHMRDYQTAWMNGRERKEQSR